MYPPGNADILELKLAMLKVLEKYGFFPKKDTL